MDKRVIKPILYGILASLVLLGVYFAALSFLSGWNFTLQQFYQFWYFITALAIGFGIQIALYFYLKAEIKNKNIGGSGKTLVATGATSTLAMVSCCAHYLVNILPILGVAGILTIIAQYQIQLFWIGLISNAFGIAYITNKIIGLKKQT
jgi:P-type Cu+ transporter